MLTVYENISTIVAVIVVCITILTVIAGKIEERSKTAKISLTWLMYEVGSSLIAGYVAWDIYPYLPMPSFLTRTVFVVLAIHGGVRFIEFIKNKVFDKAE